MDVDLITDQTIPSGSLNSIVFDLMTNGDIEKLCKVSIMEANDVTSAKLGLPNASSQCATCGSTNLKECDGHYGFIKLPKTIYHPFFLTEVVHILNQICPGCKSVKKDLQMKSSFILEASENTIGENIYILEALGKNLNTVQRKLLKLCRTNLSLNKNVHFINLTKCSKIRKNWVGKDSRLSCKYCARKTDGWYPSVKFKISSSNILGRRSLSIIAEVNEKLPKKFYGKSLSEMLPEDYWDFIPNVSLQHGPKPSMIDLTPKQVFCLLKELDPEFIQQFVSRRELLFLSYLPITPNCHRVTETSHVFADGPRLTFDDRTRAYKRLADLSRKIGEFRHHQQFGPLAASYTTGRVLDCWNVSKLRAVNSSSGDSSGPGIRGLRWLKDVVLSKRSDNAFRMTMVGDPMIKLNEIGIPRDISAKLIVAEQVNAYNLEKLNMFCNGYLVHNLHLLTEESLRIRNKGNVTYLRKTNQLQVGDVLYRPLENGDIILVNRPPSVHQHSLIAFLVRTVDIQSVISINPLCCSPLLGDFDGDCLHGYVPQSIGCRVELQELVSLDHQLFNAQDGRSLVSLTHDSLTAAYLLTAKRETFTKFDMQQFAMLCPFQLPLPAIVKAPKLSAPLWTGDQLFGMLIPPTLDFHTNSRNIVISKGEIMSSPGVSFWLRNATGSLFSTMFKRYGRKSLDYLYCAQELLCEYLSLRGLSVSLSDVYLSSDSYSRRKMIGELLFGLEEAEDACRVKQLMLEPAMENLLMCHKEDEVKLNCMSQYKFSSRRTWASQISVAAFKDVYQELLSVLRQFIDKDNTMLAMIDAGSKGSLLKLIQQGACLGLQLSARALPFTVPPKLNCYLWNDQKALCCGVPDASKSLYGQSSYAVITASFLDGLNPLECFVHAISGRANLFSENAALPGTLTRKLMFHMRDLYVSYDGTVRNAYGQQIVEFSYSNFEDSTDADDSFDAYDGDDVECPGLGGEPVGSWSACSISEAAYGALDFPINILEDSPLMKLKAVLECCKANSSTNHAALFFLAKPLKGWRYGFEYGALEVKNHLERVFFSDLVSTVKIYYDGHNLQGANISPWTMHFHVNKVIMVRKRLSLNFVKNKLQKSYDSRREKMDMILPRLCFLSKNCSSDNRHEHDESSCITVGAETSELHVQLETIRDRVIPLLLETLVKGFSASERVEILCESLPGFGSEAELFLKVTMSKNCLPGSYWCTLQNYCIPIMDLIDWERSHPDNTYNVFSTYGIDAAWKYFVNSLKSITAGTGRDILKEHLFMAADCLSVTGEFHGLSTKGLRKQRDDMSISSPFTQACLSNPVNSFVNAAKQGSMDNLDGTLDALAWGKEAPIGTGGPFEIRHSGKVPKLNRKESIYKTLHNLNNDLQLGGNKLTVPANWKQQAKHFSCVGGVESIGPLAFDKDHLKEKNFSKNPVTNFKVHSKIQRNSANGFLAKTSAFRFKSSLECTDVVDMYISLRMILHKYAIGDHLDEEDKSLLRDALYYHPKKDAKIGSGIQEIKVGYSSLHPGSRCFVLSRSDGTLEDFSYRKCVAGAANLISPEFGSFVHKKIYHRG
ncbi:hypothetical protein Cni_G18770 [Canna indica]|uniref:DNA-directed RNA polymerase subunit n=1 Tax=Canna indica TaxID=4628 RepID=A0AAQ3KQA8_9LILI|nr:hypothetical protein Cni_G18770 [Canna indica]